MSAAIHRQRGMRIKVFYRLLFHQSLKKLALDLIQI